MRDIAACCLGDHQWPGALFSFFPGTLLPRLPSEPGMSLLTIKIQKIGLKDAGQCIDPYMTISVKGKRGSSQILSSLCASRSLHTGSEQIAWFSNLLRSMDPFTPAGNVRKAKSDSYFFAPVSKFPQAKKRVLDFWHIKMMLDGRWRHINNGKPVDRVVPLNSPTDIWSGEVSLGPISSPLLYWHRLFIYVLSRGIESGGLFNA